MSADAKSSDIKAPLRPISRTNSGRDRLEPTSDISELHARLRADPRFNPPAPSPWKRAALIAAVLVLLYFAYQLRKPLMMPMAGQEVVHARRYSHEYKFRPAASPVITETIGNGKVRLRGALPTLR